MGLFKPSAENVAAKAALGREFAHAPCAVEFRPASGRAKYAKRGYLRLYDGGVGWLYRQVAATAADGWSLPDGWVTYEGVISVQALLLRRDVAQVLLSLGPTPSRSRPAGILSAAMSATNAQGLVLHMESRIPDDRFIPL